MKKVKLKGKLTLNKQTIARLNSRQMGAIYGGSAADALCFETEVCGVSVAGERALDCQGTSAMIICGPNETLANNQTCDTAAGCQASNPCQITGGAAQSCPCGPEYVGTIAATLCLSCIPNP